MPEVGDFGERAATEDEVEDWVDMVRTGRAATRGYRTRSREEQDRDSMRPAYGSGLASSEGEG